jgi:hypothetical protein
MKKQTAVEWLIKKLTNRQNGVFDALPHLSLDEIYSQAKAMEKEQIKDIYIAGFNQRDEVDKGLFFNPLAVTYCEKVFSQYYNETFGGDK